MTAIPGRLNPFTHRTPEKMAEMRLKERHEMMWSVGGAVLGIAGIAGLFATAAGARPGPVWGVLSGVALLGGVTAMAAGGGKEGAERAYELEESWGGERVTEITKPKNVAGPDWSVDIKLKNPAGVPDEFYGTIDPVVSARAVHPTLESATAAARSSSDDPHVIVQHSTGDYVVYDTETRVNNVAFGAFKGDKTPYLEWMNDDVYKASDLPGWNDNFLDNLNKSGLKHRDSELDAMSWFVQNGTHLYQTTQSDYTNNQGFVEVKP